MAKSGYSANLVPNTATFGNMLDRLNAVSTDLGTSVVTMSPDINTGDMIVNGAIQAQTSIIFGTLRGGNTTTPNTLNITTNVAVAANVSANVATFTVATTNTLNSNSANVVTQLNVANNFLLANSTVLQFGKVANTTTPVINVSSNSTHSNTTITANSNRTVIGTNGTWAIVSNTGASLFSYFAANNNFIVNTNITMKTTREVVSTPAISANVLTLDLAASGVFEVTLNSAITSIVLNNRPPSGELVTWQVRFKHSNTTVFPITWPPTHKWAGNTAPVFTFAANTISTCTFQTTDAANTTGIISAFFSGST